MLIELVVYVLLVLFFDEFESVSSKEKNTLRELINSVYKRGNKITRYKETKKNGTTDYVPDYFYPYYPLGLANIVGFGDVLSDRSLQIILKRSEKQQTKLIEDFKTNPDIIQLKTKLERLNSTIPQNIFSHWNNFIENKKYNTELKPLFEKIQLPEINGRPLEIFFPLFVVADLFSVLDVLITDTQTYLKKLEGESLDNSDDLLQAFVEKMDYDGYIDGLEILSGFKVFSGESEEWLNSKWLGRALKRLDLYSNKRHVNGKVEYYFNRNTTNTTNTTITTNTTNNTNNTYTTNSINTTTNNNSKEITNGCVICGKYGNVLIGNKTYCKECSYNHGNQTKIM